MSPSHPDQVDFALSSGEWKVLRHHDRDPFRQREVRLLRSPLRSCSALFSAACAAGQTQRRVLAGRETPLGFYSLWRALAAIDVAEKSCPV